MKGPLSGLLHHQMTDAAGQTSSQLLIRRKLPVQFLHNVVINLMNLFWFIIFCIGHVHWLLFINFVLDLIKTLVYTSLSKSIKNFNDYKDISNLAMIQTLNTQCWWECLCHLGGHCLLNQSSTGQNLGLDPGLGALDNFGSFISLWTVGLVHLCLILNNNFCSSFIICLSIQALWKPNHPEQVTSCEYYQEDAGESVHSGMLY